MATAPYHRSYERARSAEGAGAAGYVRNPASYLTDQGAGPAPADLGWCIRRRWRVIYYSHRHAASLPLWEGAADFEVLMADVLYRLSSGFEPIEPECAPKALPPEERPGDPRQDRVYQLCCRILRTPVLRERRWKE